MELNVQVKVEGLVSFVIHADSLEEGLDIARKKASKRVFYDEDLDVIDSSEEVVGIY